MGHRPGCPDHADSEVKVSHLARAARLSWRFLHLHLNHDDGQTPVLLTSDIDIIVARRTTTNVKPHSIDSTARHIQNKLQLDLPSIVGNVVLKSRTRRLESKHERPRDNVGTIWTRVGVVIGVVAVDRSCARLLVQSGRVETVVDEGRTARGGGVLCVADEAVSGVTEGTALPRVVGCGYEASQSQR